MVAAPKMSPQALVPQLAVHIAEAFEAVLGVDLAQGMEASATSPKPLRQCWELTSPKAFRCAGTRVQTSAG